MIDYVANDVKYLPEHLTTVYAETGARVVPGQWPGTGFYLRYCPGQRLF